jgi:hypothetical protein
VGITWSYCWNISNGYIFGIEIWKLLENLDEPQGRPRLKTAPPSQVYDRIVIENLNVPGQEQETAS